MWFWKNKFNPSKIFSIPLTSLNILGVQWFSQCSVVVVAVAVKVAVLVVLAVGVAVAVVVAVVLVLEVAVVATNSLNF